jgi:hypothetical protein
MPGRRSGCGHWLRSRGGSRQWWWSRHRVGERRDSPPGRAGRRGRPGAAVVCSGVESFWSLDVDDLAAGWWHLSPIDIRMRPPSRTSCVLLTGCDHSDANPPMVGRSIGQVPRPTASRPHWSHLLSIICLSPCISVAWACMRPEQVGFWRSQSSGYVSQQAGHDLSPRTCGCPWISMRNAVAMHSTVVRSSGWRRQVGDPTTDAPLASTRTLLEHPADRSGG